MAQEKKQDKTQDKTKAVRLWGVAALEKVLVSTKELLNRNILDFALRWIFRIGHIGLLAAAALGFLFSLIVAIRLDSFSAFLYGIAWVVLVLVVQYAAHRFAATGDSLIENNPSSLTSKAFLDCLGLLSVIGGLIAFVLGAIRSIQGSGIRFILAGTALFILLELFAIVVFNPETVSTETGGKNSAGQEAIGIIVLFIKGFMRLVPILFGIGIAAGFVLLAIDAFGIFGSEYRLLADWKRAMYTGRIIVFSGLVPFLSYIGFVIAYLAVDVVRAILATPEKIEALRK